MESFVRIRAFYYPGSRAFVDFWPAQRMRASSFRHLRRNVLLRYTLCLQNPCALCFDSLIRVNEMKLIERKTIQNI